MVSENTKEKNISLIRRFFEEQANEGNTSQYTKFLSENVIIYGPGSGQTTKGLKEAQKLDDSYVDAYPEKTFTIEEIEAIDNRVFVRWDCVGIHKKPLKGMLPEDSKFNISGLSIYHVEDEKIQTIWQFWDRLGLLEQIGEVVDHTQPVEPGYYLKLLKSIGIHEGFDLLELLTLREKQCMQALLEGKSAKETASAYDLSSRTIESYYENIKKKLNCYTKRDLFEVARVLEKLKLL